MNYIETNAKFVKPGDVYGRYTVKGIYRKPDSYPKYALVACECGSPERYVRLDILRSRASTSCGCFHKEAVTTHGMWGHPVFRCWGSMMARCHNPKDKSYPRYGGAGITVCERWQSVENFVADMGDTFAPGLTIERIDNSKGYEPGNCRWATHAEQNRNVSRNVVIEFRSKSMCLMDWAAQVGINYGTLWDRLNEGWPVEKALTTPARRLNKNRTEQELISP